MNHTYRIIISTGFFAVLFLCTNVQAQELTMFTKTGGFGGYEYYQDDKLIDKSTVKSLMLENSETAEYWKVADNATTGAIVFGVANLGTFVWFISELDEIEEDGDVLKSASFWSVVGTGIVSGIFTSRAIKHRKKAILKYNSLLDGDTGYYFTPSKKGLGIAMNF